jgi:hypothetical protein
LEALSKLDEFVGKELKAACMIEEILAGKTPKTLFLTRKRVAEGEMKCPETFSGKSPVF